MYDHSGRLDYVGYRDYVASKAGMMLLEAGVGMVMETVSIIEQNPDLDPMEALDMSIHEFGQWMKDAASRVKTYVADCEHNQGTTYGSNVNQVFVHALSYTDYQQTADYIQGQLKAIYDWDHWVVAVAKYDKNDDKYHCVSAN